MKARQLKWMAALAAMAAGTTLALAADATLKIGDPAPKLQTGKWVQGEPVRKFEPGTAYLVEFWATASDPCRASIPHLNELHTKYKDRGLIVIGQDCQERDESLVAPFVKERGEEMTYRVTLDDKTESEEGKMAETWMAAAGRDGVPTAFLVDTKGIIVWIGHPLQLKEKVLEEVLAGKYDVQKAAADYQQQQKNQAQLRPLWMALTRALQNKDWDEATAKLAEVEKLTPADERDSLDLVRLAILVGKEDYPAVYKLAAKVSETHKDNAILQHQLAWQIATAPEIKQRDLALAETIASRANAAAKGKEPAILDTLARVKFMEGKKQEAIALQQKAAELAAGSQQKQFQKTLESYKRDELPKVN